jgi:16S rRNA (uracil1498-N3)-methyltransferase
MGGILRYAQDDVNYGLECFFLRLGGGFSFFLLLKCSGYNLSVRRRFFVEQFEDATATLRGDAAEHLGRVLRAEPGQLYELSDGARVWLARVESIGMLKRGENRIEFSLVEPVAVPESKLRVDLLIALVKFDRFEWCLEKATELGVAKIVPMAAARSDRALVAVAEKRRERWEKILVESAQQSRRLSAPRFGAVTTAEKAFAASRDAELRVMLSERREAEPLRNVLRAKTSNSVVLAIGPEGGWTDSEFEAAGAARFSPASLGHLILRTETAVAAALASVNLVLGG